MDQRLAKLIGDFQKKVDEAIYIMQASGVAMPESNLAWACNGMKHRGFWGPVAYRKHGSGCEVFLRTGPVDFDFGPRGETWCFDSWRLVQFAEGRLEKFGFSSDHELEASFTASVEAGELVANGDLYSLSKNAG